MRGLAAAGSLDGRCIPLAARSGIELEHEAGCGAQADGGGRQDHEDWILHVHVQRPAGRGGSRFRQGCRLRCDRAGRRRTYQDRRQSRGDGRQGAGTADLFVASITFFGNQLDPDAEKRRELRARTADLAMAAPLPKVPILVIFPGRDPHDPGRRRLQELRRAGRTADRADAGKRPRLRDRELAGSEERLSGHDAGRLAAAVRPHSRSAVRPGIRPFTPDPARH